MKHVLVALLLGVIGIFMWTYHNSPEEWESWRLQTQREIAELTGEDVSEIEESLFFLRRDALLEKYDAVESEYESAKAQLEGEFGVVKSEIDERGGDDVTLEGEVAKFQQKIEEKKALFIKRKAEIEAEIAEVRQQYEETKATLRTLNDSVKKIKEGAQEGVEAIEALKESAGME